MNKIKILYVALLLGLCVVVAFPFLKIKAQRRLSPENCFSPGDPQGVGASDVRFVRRA